MHICPESNTCPILLSSAITNGLSIASWDEKQSEVYSYLCVVFFRYPEWIILFSFSGFAKSKLACEQFLLLLPPPPPPPPPGVFYSFGELSAIFNKLEIVVCKLFQFPRMSLTFVVWERVNGCTCTRSSFFLSIKRVKHGMQKLKVSTVQPLDWWFCGEWWRFCVFLIKMHFTTYIIPKLANQMFWWSLVR